MDLLRLRATGLSDRCFNRLLAQAAWTFSCNLHLLKTGIVASTFTRQRVSLLPVVASSMPVIRACDRLTTYGQLAKHGQSNGAAHAEVPRPE